MFNRSVYIERVAVLTTGGLAPIIASLLVWQGDYSATTAVLMLLGCSAVMALVGAIAGTLIHRSLAIGNIPWGGHEETAALIKQAIGELIGNNADEKLNQAAMNQANAQEGRATAIYLTSRINQLRHMDAKSGGAQNPIPLQRRLFWILLSLLLGASGALIPVFAPDFSQQNAALIALAVLAPLWLTGLAITGLGLENANRWIPLPRRSDKGVKIKARKTATTAGSWHTKQNRSDIPLFRVILLFPVVVAAGLYLLREFGPQPQPEGYDEVSFSDTATAPARVTAPTATPRKQTSTPPPSRTTSSQQTASRDNTRKATDSWEQIPPNGSTLRANTQSLSYAGWDINSIKAALDESRQRMNQWYVSFLRDHPTAVGRVSLRLILQPEGYVSRIEVIASEIGDPDFLNALRDRLEASALPGGALDSASVVYSMDFRP